jgi:peptidoglycan/xylan/chitin deacetylase (PgdA/CDA1 family)
MSAYIEGTMDIKKPFTPGATAPFSNAPPIPTGLPNPASYPALDTIPPTNSPEVQEWLKQIDLTKIPNIKPTVDGSCDGDPAAAADKSRCWWTCGGCVRDTDISVCPDKNTWGVSYDDGPSPYTPKLLNYLDEKSIKATFFVVGSRVVSRPDMLRAEHIAGHEISVHTWSHHPLTTMTNEQIVAELGWTMKAIKDVVGVTPTTMRPPFGDIDDRVRAISMAMGLTPILWTGSGESEFDTDDWRIPGGTATGQSSFDQFNKILGLASSLNTGFIVLEHDLYQETVDMAVGYFLPSAETHNPPFKLEAINQCLGKSLADVYVETRTSTGNNSTKGGSGSGSGKGGSGSTNGTAGGSGNGAGAIAAPRYLAGIAAVAGVVGAGAILL